MTNVDKHPKSGVYRFRRAVPKKLRAILGKTEILESLGTKDVTEAKRRAKAVGIRVDKLFEAASQGKVGISRSEASQIVQAWKYEQLKRDEEERLSAAAFTGTVAETIQNIENFASLCLRLEELKRAEDRYDYAVIKPDLTDLLTASGKVVDLKSGAFQMFAGKLFKVSREVVEEKIRRSQGDWSASDAGIQVMPSHQRSVPSIDGASPPLSRIHSLWEEETQPPKKTKSDWKTAIRRFSEVAGGDIPIRQITKQHGREFKQAMLKFPRVLKGKQRKMTVPEILDGIGTTNSAEKLSDQTVNKHIAALASVFSWAIDNGYIDSNPMTGLKIKQRNIRDRRLPYDANDLALIFSSPLYTGCQSEKKRADPGSLVFRDASFWLPLLALFTGARLEELGQARARDLREEDGNVFLDVNTLEEDQSLKSATSKRPVPLHPDLVACGFGEYVASLKKARDTRLFPDLHADSRGTYTANWSKWWRRYARQIGINDRRKVFHSFRHNFKDACRRAGIEEAIHDALTGHSHKSVGRGYGLGYPVTILAHAINKIDYPSLDLSHIEVKQQKSA